MPSRLVDSFERVVKLKDGEALRAMFWVVIFFLAWQLIGKEDDCRVELARLTAEIETKDTRIRYSDSITMKVLIDAKNEVERNNRRIDSANTALAKAVDKLTLK